MPVERATPKARVLAYIREYYPNGPRKLVELKGVKSVNTTTPNSGMGTATVTVSNFKSANIRYLGYEDLVGNTSAEQLAVINNYGSEYVAEDLANNFNWRDFVLNKAGTSIFTENNWGFKGVDGAEVKATIKSEKICQSRPFVDLFDMVFIDYMGQDGFWYAGFSGLITRIGDSRQRTANQTLTLQCKDYTVLFDNTSLVTSFNMLKVAEKEQKLRAFIYSTDDQLEASKSSYTNIFSAYDNSIEEVILEIVRRAQDMWRLDIMPDEGIGVKGLLFDTSQVYTYEGISNRRGSIWHPQINGNVEVMNPQYFKSYYDLYKYHYMYDGSKPSQKSGQTPRGYRLINGVGDKKILIDPLIRELDQVFIAKMLNNTFSLFSDSLKSANEMLDEIANKMMCYKYFDSNGNLVFELPKYNALPNTTEYGGRSSATTIKHAAVSVDYGNTDIWRVCTLNGRGDPETVFASYLDSASAVKAAENLNNEKNRRDITVYKDSVIGGLQITADNKNGRQVIPKSSERTVQGKSYDYSSLNFHGINYFPSADDSVSFDTSIDEATLVTQSSITADYSYMDVDPNLKNSTFNLYGTAVESYDLLSKLGVRKYQSQNLYNVKWPNAVIGSRVMSYMAAAILNRVNASADSGTCQFNHRPELQIGRTIIDPYRLKIYYISGISQSWSQGSTIVTTPTLDFGHDISTTLEQAWLALVVEDNIFNPEDLNNSVAVDKNGVKKTTQRNNNITVENVE